MQATANTVEQHLLRVSAAARATYPQLRRVVGWLGLRAQNPKSRSIHCVCKTVCAAVAMHRESLILTIKSDRALAHPGVFRTTHTSAGRWHHETRLRQATAIDAELMARLETADALSA